MPAKVDELALRVEAILFASGKPLSVAQITEALSLSDHRPVQAALKALGRTYLGRQTSLELRRVGDRYALQLREEYVPVARVVTPMEMAPKTLKALTLVAYHQPMLQSFLVRMIGEGAYEEVPRLRSMGLVRAEPKGATLELTTTRGFAEYFGIGSTKPEEIRQYLERRLGAGAAAPPPEPATLGAEPRPAANEPERTDSSGPAPAPEIAPAGTETPSSEAA
jgi:segregation and condensation protein B